MTDKKCVKIGVLQCAKFGVSYIVQHPNGEIEYIKDFERIKPLDQGIQKE